MSDGKPMYVLSAVILISSIIFSWSIISAAGIINSGNDITGAIIAGTGSTGTGNAQQQAQPSPSPTPTPTPSPTAQVSADDDPVKGNPNAPVTIIEFSDFQCPFCGRFYEQTLPQVVQNYIDTGKAKLVYRDFPLSFHPNAQPAAEAAECANEQSKFWEFHNKIFENQDSLSAGSYKQWAADLGLDTGQFNSCIDSGKYTSEVQKDLADGQAAGVSGTPTFFINGQKLVGAQPYSVFQSTIDAALNA